MKKKKKKIPRLLHPFSKEIYDLREEYPDCPKCHHNLAWTYPQTAICPNCGWILHHAPIINFGTNEIKNNEYFFPFLTTQSIFKRDNGLELLVRVIPEIVYLITSDSGKKQIDSYDLPHQTDSRLPTKQPILGMSPGYLTLQISDVLYVYGNSDGVTIDFGVAHIHLTKGESKKLRQLLAKAEEEKG